MEELEQEVLRLERRLADTLMYLIDCFISLQLRAKNIDKKYRYDYLVKNYRNMIADEFERQVKDHPIYLNQIRTKESGPYAKDAFDINQQPNLLNL